MKKASSRNRLFVVLPLLMASCLTLRDAIISPVWAAEAVAPPVMYPADLWQGRGEAVIRILNRTDSHIETLTVPVGGQAQYRSLHVGVTRCVERPETLPRDAAALITTTDETDPDTHYEGWILAEEPSLTGYKSALYGISIVSCSGPKADPSLAPLPPSVLPTLTRATAEGAQNQPGDLDDPNHAPTGPGVMPSQSPPRVPAGFPGSPGSLSGRPSTAPAGGPTALTPLGESSAPSRPTASATRQIPQQMPRQLPHQESGGPTQLAPLSGGTGQALPPPQPYN